MSSANPQLKSTGLNHEAFQFEKFCSGIKMKRLLICLVLVAICNADMLYPDHCVRMKQRYASGMMVLQRVDEETKICRGKVCLGGKVRSWKNRECFEPYKQCDYEQADGGKLDAGFGMVLYESSGMCKGVVCTHGKIKEYPVTSCPRSPTTMVPTTTPGCLPSESTTGRSGNWCYGTYCQDGVIISWDSTCVETTPAPTTMPETTTPECVEGEQTKFKDGNWCYGTLCQGGVLLHWDNFECDDETTTTPPTTSNLPINTTPTA